MYLQSQGKSEVTVSRSYLGVEGPVALRPGLKSKDQTLVRAVKREREVGEQSALILQTQRGYSTGVLLIRGSMQNHKS